MAIRASTSLQFLWLQGLARCSNSCKQEKFPCSAAPETFLPKSMQPERPGEASGAFLARQRATSGRTLLQLQVQRWTHVNPPTLHGSSERHKETPNAPATKNQQDHSDETCCPCTNNWGTGLHAKVLGLKDLLQPYSNSRLPQARLSLFYSRQETPCLGPLPQATGALEDYRDTTDSVTVFCTSWRHRRYDSQMQHCRVFGDTRTDTIN